MDSSRPLRAIRLVLADPQSDVREGLRAALGTEPDVEVVDEAPDAAGLLAAAALALPDVVLVDLTLLRAFGGGLVPAILARAPGSRIVVLSALESEASIQAALKEGAHAHLPKDAFREELIAIVREVAGQAAGRNDLAAKGRGRAGAHDVPGSVAAERRIQRGGENGRDVRGNGSVGPPGRDHRFEAFEDSGDGAEERDPGTGLHDDDRRGSDLTPREVEILRLIARGRSNREIGAALSISEGTVKGHLQRIFHKMGVDDRTQAAIAALKRGAIRL